MKKHRKKTPGSTPGSVIYVGDQLDVAFSIEKIVFNEEEIEVKTYREVPEKGELSGSANHKTWIHVAGLHDAEKVSEVCGRFGLHPLVIEDILNSRHRPKAEFFDDHLVVILKILTLDEGDSLASDQIAVIFTKDTILTFSQREIDFFKPVLNRIDNCRGRIRSYPVCYLGWAILDTIIDHYLLLIERFDEKVSALDESVYESFDNIGSHELFVLKKKVSEIFRQIRPVREIVYQIQRSDWEHISPESKPFFTDLYDHVVNALENVEHLRDQTSALRDYYLASVSNRMNEIMKVLTCFSAIFLPLTFLAGIYGMNFDYLPELRWKYSYPVLWLVFGILVAGMLYFFRKRKWL